MYMENRCAFERVLNTTFTNFNYLTNFNSQVSLLLPLNFQA